MAEYISREAAIKLFNFAVLDCLGMEPTIRAGDIIKALESIPAADVRPVVRGRWEKGTSENGVTTALFCSCCHYENRHWYEWSYCPNCGADMREES